MLGCRGKLPKVLPLGITAFGRAAEGDAKLVPKRELSSANRKPKQAAAPRAPASPASESSPILAEDGLARSRKIAGLRAAVASGAYQVSAADLAEKLIDSMLRR